jgi:hypothetical protein
VFLCEEITGKLIVLNAHIREKERQLGVMAYDYHSSFLGGSRRIVVCGQPKQKELARTHLNQQARCDGHAYNSSYMGNIDRRIIV